MNDRIRELYQQAHSIRHHDGDPMRDGNPPTVYWQGEKSAEKFAELILEEIMQELIINGHDDAFIFLNKHFGVEE